MPNSYKIPQNVNLEDKILGPLTLKQFLYLLAAGMATFFSFSVFWQFAPGVFYVVTFTAWIIAVAFAFVRPNEQPFIKFAFAFLWFSLKPSRRVWDRIPSLGEIDLTDQSEEKATPKDNRPSPQEVRSRLQRLAHIVDTRGWEPTDDEQPDITARVTGGEAKPKINVGLTDANQPEDILAKEDEASGSDRVSAELERVLKTVKEKLPKQNQAAR